MMCIEDVQGGWWGYGMWYFEVSYCPVADDSQIYANVILHEIFMWIWQLRWGSLGLQVLRIVERSNCAQLYWWAHDNIVDTEYIFSLYSVLVSGFQAYGDIFGFAGIVITLWRKGWWSSTTLWPSTSPGDKCSFLIFNCLNLFIPNCCTLSNLGTKMHDSLWWIELVIISIKYIVMISIFTE